MNANDALPRVGVLHGRGASISLREVLVGAIDVCTPVILFRADELAAEPRLRRAAEAVAEVRSFASLTPDAKSLDGLSGVTTFLDKEAGSVWAVGGGVGESPWDKLRQRRILRAAGVSSFGAESVDSADDFSRAWRVIGEPIVLKPRLGHSSASVRILSSAEEVRREIRSRRHWRGLLAEKYIPAAPEVSGFGWFGDIVSVETISSGGFHRSVAVFDKLPFLKYESGFGDDDAAIREVGEVTPSRLPSRNLAEVVEMVARALHALGVEWGVTHSEVKLGLNGPEIVEVNGRAGGKVTSVLRVAGGPDLVRSAFECALRIPASTVDRTVRGGAVHAYLDVALSRPRSDWPVLNRERLATSRDIVMLGETPRGTPDRSVRSLAEAYFESRSREELWEAFRGFYQAVANSVNASEPTIAESFEEYLAIT